MKSFLILLSAMLAVHGETLRVSKVSERAGLDTVQMRQAREGGFVTYHVEKKPILTSVDVASARVVPKNKGVIEVKLSPEGAKKLAEATKGADGTLRLAILVEDVLECVPLVQSELSDTFWISGLDDREPEGLQKLAEDFLKSSKEGEEAVEEDE